MLLLDSVLLFVLEEVERIVFADELHDVPIGLQNVFLLWVQGHRVRLGVIERDVDQQRIVVYTMNALDEVKSVGMRLAAVTKPGLIVKTRGVGDDRASPPAAKRAAHPGAPRVR